MDWSLIVGILEMLLAALAAWMAWRASKGVQEVHLSLNSRLDAFLALTRESAHAEGKLEGIKHGEQAALQIASEVKDVAEKIVKDVAAVEKLVQKEEEKREQ